MWELLLDYGSRKRAEARLSTFHRLLKEEEKPYSLETIKRVMSDHSKVGPIWDVSTRSGQIFLPSQGRMFYFEGAPNCTEMEEYRI